MTFEEFQAFIDSQDALLRSINKGGTGNHSVLARTVKLGEEYGELCDEVLASISDHWKGKLNKKRDLPGEFADVVIVAFLLAKAMNVDMREALKDKIKVIRTKHNKQLRKGMRK